jgi:glutamyl-tRNA synthetase
VTPGYRGRLAPSPTGLLHIGHARTFLIAAERANAAGGALILRNEDLDRDRVRPEFVAAIFEDLRWIGLDWAEGPDIGEPCAPYDQSARLDLHRAAFERLRALDAVYPCSCSRREIRAALSAPHDDDDEPLYPGICRNSPSRPDAERISWRFRVPDGETIRFEDSGAGPCAFVAGRDFGDFVVWRHDGLPSYQLAVIVDDAAMRITEVVRGMDLLRSTARQILLYRALNLAPPIFHHALLVLDETGRRLAKRHAGLSLRELRESGITPSEARRMAFESRT